VADLIVQHLRDAGTRALFGVPGGGGNLDLIEAAGRADLPFVLTSTETGAAIAAIAQSEVTGRPGACLTTLGPGAASAVNGVACAFLDRAPIVIFTDSNPIGARGMFAHQHLDHLALFEPITKWSARLEPGRVSRTIDEAFKAVATMPPGPVHLDSPGDVSALDDDSGIRVDTHDERLTPPAAWEAAAARARKPLLIVGLGARQSEAAAAIRRLCSASRIPAMVTYKAKGVVPDDHACFAGVFTNGAIERTLIEESDLIVGLGLDPVEVLPRPWTFRQPVIGAGRWRCPDAHVPFGSQWTTDIPRAAAVLADRWTESAWDLDRVAAVVAETRKATDIPTAGMSAQRVVDVAAGLLAADCRVTVDAGAHMLPATLRWPVRQPAGMLISNGLSTMGFALPAAIGAALVDGGPVVALTGDGGLLMCAGELLTAARQRLRVITIVFNDASLSLIEIKQQARRLRPEGVALGAVSWRALGESFGVTSFAAGNEHALARAIEQARAVDGPTLIEAAVDRSNYGAMLKVIRG
jgi:acetolactate synthase-1/2/3 large subunit